MHTNKHMDEAQRKLAQRRIRPGKYNQMLIEAIQEEDGELMVPRITSLY